MSEHQSKYDQVTCSDIEGQFRHTEYIGSWIELLKDDPRAIFTAASKASQAADFLSSFSEANQNDDSGEAE